MSKNVRFALAHVYASMYRLLHTYTHTMCDTYVHARRFSYANATDVRALNKIRRNDSIYKYLASNEHGIRRFKLLSPYTRRMVSRSRTIICVDWWK